MESKMFPVSINDKFQFSCSKDAPCFNECCRDLNQFLMPYDILRLKNRMKISSEEFLKKYTSRHTGPETGLPVVTLKPDTADQSKQCPFVTPEGCKVYEDRPSSCRMYPLARMISRSRETGEITEHYALLKEPHCFGFGRGEPETVKEWINSQEITLYNEMNDKLIEFISLKNRIIPGPLDMKASSLFFMACYNLDVFRSHILNNGLPEGFNSANTDAAVNDDVKLLDLGYQWIKFVLFGKI